MYYKIEEKTVAIRRICLIGEMMFDYGETKHDVCLVKPVIKNIIELLCDVSTKEEFEAGMPTNTVEADLFKQLYESALDISKNGLSPSDIVKRALASMDF